MPHPRTYSPSQVPEGSDLVVAWRAGSAQSAHIGPEKTALITEAVATIGAPETSDAVVRIVSPWEAGRQIAVVSVPDAASPSDYRNAAAMGVRELPGTAPIAVSLPVTTQAEVSAAYEGTHLGAYVFDQFLSPRKPTKVLSVVDPVGCDSAALDRAEVLVDAQNRIRTLVNLPASYVTPWSMENAAREVAALDGVSIEVLNVPELADAQCGGILGVGQGSVHEPRLIKVTWAPAESHAHLALVGKGITFDSGGMSLKSHEGLIDMKTDMTGAATVLETVRAVATLRLPVTVTAWMCVAENMLSGSAMHVGDILTMANGLTVEVNNTDAEGRLVLGDGLSLAIRENPDEVIDVATLTGAQIRGLGYRYAGVMGTDDTVAGVCAAAEQAGELVWPMPLPTYLRANLESPVASMKNSGGAEAGMLVAGLFLKEFVGDTPWAHIDIAGPSFNPAAAWGEAPQGATGCTLRTLVARAEALASR